MTWAGAGGGVVVTPLTSEGSLVRNQLRPPETPGQGLLRVTRGDLSRSPDRHLTVAASIGRRHRRSGTGLEMTARTGWIVLGDERGLVLLAALASLDLATPVGFDPTGPASGGPPTATSPKCEGAVQ